MAFVATAISFLNELVYFIHANLENENQAVNKILTEIKDRNHSSILEAKESFRIEKQAMETKMKETMLAKAEIEASLELLSEKYEALRLSKDTEDRESH